MASEQKIDLCVATARLAAGRRYEESKLRTYPNLFDVPEDGRTWQRRCPKLMK